MVPMLPLLALAAGGAWLYSRSKGSAPAASAHPPYDVNLDASTARAVDIAIGNGFADDGSPLPPETDPARVRAFVSRLSGYPIAQATLNRYAATLGSPGASSPRPSPGASSPRPSSGSSSSGGAASSTPPSAPSAPPTFSVADWFGGGAPAAPAPAAAGKVRDAKSAQAALVAWNTKTGAGGDYGKQGASDVDGIPGPRTIAATRAFQKFVGLEASGTFNAATYAALEPYASSAPASPAGASPMVASAAPGRAIKVAPNKVLTPGTDILTKRS